MISRERAWKLTTESTSLATASARIVGMEIPYTVEELIDATSHGGFGLLTVNLPDPAGYGRIVRNDGGRVQRIVEHKDAGAEELQIREVNTGIMSMPRDRLRDWLASGNAA